MQSITDYTMARRAVLSSFAAGHVMRSEICDGHPDLLRCARHHGEPARTPCPVCDGGTLVYVTFAFGDRLGNRNGRTVTVAERPAFLGIDGVRLYTVEVCTDCTWNHLIKSIEAMTAASGSGSDAAGAAPRPRP